MEETGEPGENHRPVASHWQTLSHNVVHLALIEIRTHNISDCIGSCKSNYHTIAAMTAISLVNWQIFKTSQIVGSNITKLRVEIEWFWNFILDIGELAPHLLPHNNKSPFPGVVPHNEGFNHDGPVRFSTL